MSATLSGTWAEVSPVHPWNAYLQICVTLSGISTAVNPTLWNRYYFVEAVGHISESSVAKYIETYNSKSPFIPRLKPGEFPGITLKDKENFEKLIRKSYF